MRLGLALALGALTLTGCAAANQKVGVRFDAGGQSLGAPARAHVALWSAPAGTKDPGTLVVQDEVEVTALPTTLTLVAPAPGWGQRLVYWLEAEVDSNGDGAIGTDDWVLVPAPPVSDLAELGRVPVWAHPKAVAVSGAQLGSQP